MEPNLFQPVTCVPHPVFVPSYHLPESMITVASQAGLDLSGVLLRPIVLHSIVFALFGSLIAPFGGFFASAIKRAYNKKDFVCTNNLAVLSQLLMVWYL